MPSFTYPLSLSLQTLFQTDTEVFIDRSIVALFLFIAGTHAGFSSITMNFEAELSYQSLFFPEKQTRLIEGSPGLSGLQ